jgi:hypothetical protein
VVVSFLTGLPNSRDPVELPHLGTSRHPMEGGVHPNDAWIAEYTAGAFPASCTAGQVSVIL